MLKLILNGLKLVILISLLYALYLSVFYSGLNYSIEILNPVYCERTDDSSSSKEMITVMIDNAIKKSTNINYKVKIDFSPSVYNALNLAVFAFSFYVPLWGAAEMASFFSNLYSKVGVFVGGFLIIFVIQNVNYNFLSNNLNSEVPLNYYYFPSDLNINNLFEFDSLQQGLSIVMVFFTIGILYPFISLTINLLVNELNLKNRNFIKNSPMLIKIVSYFEKTSRFYRFLMLFLIGINLIGMIITVYYNVTSYF